MEIRQLEHFVAVVDAGSFTAAARRSNIAQSGLSMSIRSLERALGTVLFVRGARGVVLTSAGTALAPEARRTLAAVRSARQVVAATHGLLAGEFSLGTGQTSPPADHVALLLGEFHRLHPDVGIKVRQGSGARVFQRLHRGLLDLVVCGRPTRHAVSITSILLLRSPMMLVCAKGHHLAKRRSVQMEDLCGEPFIDFHSDWLVRTLTDQAFEAAHVVRDTRCELDDIWLMLRMVEQGLGVAFAPRIVSQLPARVKYVPVTPEPPMWDLVASFVGKQPANVAARAFLGMVMEHDWLSQVPV